MATLEDDGWELESAVARHAQSPERFTIPSEAERSAYVAGDKVQLLVLLAGEDADGQYIQCERLWVSITEVTPDGYVGQLESRPVTSKVLQPLDQILFQPHHIASYLIRVTDPRHPHYAPPQPPSSGSPGTG